ncbi:DMT family transporter [Motiliproteus sp.]|uniref:DMT family transporter n=1 Tax=Motiliproteus sp. TaxID=1898955 RepID=UPI003BAB9E26
MTLSARLAFWLLVLVCFIWGVGFVVVDQAINHLSTLTLNSVRFALAALCLLPLHLLLGKREAEEPVPLMTLLLVSLGLGFLLFLGFYTQTEGMRYTTVSNAGFITGLCVPLTPVLGWLLFRSRAGWSVWVGAAASTLGLYWLTSGGELSFNRGDLWVLCCAFSFALHIVMTGHFAGRLPVIALSALQMAAVALYSAVASWWLDPPEQQLLFQFGVLLELLLSWEMLFVLVWLSLLSSAFAYWVQTSSQSVLPAPKVALIFALEPVFAHAAAALVLDERLLWQGWLGAGLIIAGMLIAELGESRQKPKLHPADQMAAPQPESD